MQKRPALLLATIISAIFFIWQGQTNNEPENKSSSTPTQDGEIAYYELTIPYLRERQFESELHELSEYSSGSNYNSFLTSYDSDGLKIEGLLTIPKMDPPAGGWPAIVFVHGYIAPSTYKTTEKYVEYVDYLAKNGFVVFKIDLRGHGMSEGDPGGAYYSSDYVIDTLSARKALQNADFVNPERVGLWGHSMAGNVTFRAFVTASDIPALVVWAGAGYSYLDLATYGLNDNSYRAPSRSLPRRTGSLIRETYGEYSSDSKFWQMISPMNYLENIKGAIELHHAIDDTVVNIGYSRDLMRALDSTSIPHQLFEYEQGGHNLSGDSFYLAMQRTVEFYKKTLSLE